jgi:hypothetical protein
MRQWIIMQCLRTPLLLGYDVVSEDAVVTDDRGVSSADVTRLVAVYSWINAGCLEASQSAPCPSPHDLALQLAMGHTHASGQQRE